MTIDCELKRILGMNVGITQRIYTVFIAVANNKKPGELKLRRALSEYVVESIPVGQHAHVSAAAMLEDNPLAGCLVDLVALATRLGHVFRRRFVTVAE